MPTDRWGEPIELKPRTFSLATLLRGVTLVAVLLGWLSLARTHPGVADWLVVGAAAFLGKVIGQRQRGGFWTRLAAGATFFCLALFVGGYVRAWVGLALDSRRGDPLPPTHWSAFDVVFLSCLGVLALPVVAGVAVLLLRWWTWLANVAAESRAERRLGRR